MNSIDDSEYLRIIAAVKQSNISVQKPHSSVGFFGKLGSLFGGSSSEPDPEIVAMLRQTFEELYKKGKFSEIVLHELQQLAPAQLIEAYERLISILNKSH